MFIAYLAFGIFAGIAAAIVTLFAGGGLLMALAAYVLGGMAGISLGVLWILLPGGSKPTPRPVPATQGYAQQTS